LLNGLLPLFGRVSSQVNGQLEQKRPDVYDDLSTQLDDLVYPGFLAELPPGRLKHYSRYLRAIEERLVQLAGNPVRDQQRMETLGPWWARYLDALERGCPYDEHLDAFRWLVEEYRVSLFAQKLGTAQKVSEKRLADAWRRTGC
jgi:ATP-dependent helicase HrpA